MSLDAVSYGLSALHARRFARATLAGILPASFVLAHFGRAAVNGAFDVIALVGMTAVFVLERVFLALNPPPREVDHGGHDGDNKHHVSPS